MSTSRLATRWRKAHNQEQRRNDIKADMLLLHYTGMENAKSAEDWLCCEESGVSCHYLIDELGEIVAMVDEDLRAWHAGASFWQGQSDINSHSIGIEIVNCGHFNGYPDFPDRQIEAVMALCRDIIDRHNILSARVLAHSDVAPGRKLDPGEKFPWKKLYENGIGLWVTPEPITQERGLTLGDTGAQVAALQKQLALYGYGLEVSGQYDDASFQIVEAFQRHFRPALVDGMADWSTTVTLNRLMRAAGLGVQA